MSATKLDADDHNCKWGDMPPQEIPGQLTRSMLEMRKPKAYELKELPSLPLHVQVCEDMEEVHVPTCPILQHSIKLLKYIKQANSLISVLENNSYAIYGHANQITDLSVPPPFQPKESTFWHKGRSKGFGEAGQMDKAIFVAPELDNQFREGMGDFSFPSISEEASTTLLKESIKAVGAHAGYDEITTSSLNALTGITQNFLQSFSKSMRVALDREAETGCPPFFDVLDEVLNHSGTKSLKELEKFWNSRVVQQHKCLQNQAAALSKEVRSLGRRVEAATVQATHNKFGKWTPVAGMRSGSDIGRRHEMALIGGIKRHIKPEHHDHNCDIPDPFTEREPAQENPFEFDDGVESTFSLGDLDNYHTPKKKSRNAL